MNAIRPLRILHIVGGMSRAGIETWLMHVLRTIDGQQLRMDFLAHTTQHCSYDDELQALGSRLFHCPPPTRMWQYGSAFRKVLAENGPYDVVHSHVHFASGVVLRLARQAGVGVRLAHSHINAAPDEARRGLFRRGYRALMRHWISRHATAGLSCSAVAAEDLFGPNWETDGRWRVLPYGIDLTPFLDPGPAAAVRAELGLPPGAFVIGHAGRFVWQKNHAFLIGVMAAVAPRLESAHLLLLGEGELRSEVEARVHRLGLAGRVTFAGSRPDVPRLMRHAMDVFVLPSHNEGLPVVSLEAQAAGLPLILSDVISPETDLVRPLIRRLSLTQPPEAWADAVLAARQVGAAVSPGEALAAVEASAFNIHTSSRSLEEVYRGCVERASAASRVARV